MTTTESNIPSNTIRPAGIPNKEATSDDHEVCIDVSKHHTNDTVEKMAQKKGVEIIEIDIDGDDTDAERGATIDDNKIPGLGKNGVTASIDWDNHPDSEIIRQTVYGPDFPPYKLATVGNRRGTIFNDKIKH